MCSTRHNFLVGHSLYHETKFHCRSQFFCITIVVQWVIMVCFIRGMCPTDLHGSLQVGFKQKWSIHNMEFKTLKTWHLLLHRSCGSYTSDACSHEWFNECDVIPAEYWGIAQSQGHIRQHTDALCCCIWLVLFRQIASGVRRRPRHQQWLDREYTQDRFLFVVFILAGETLLSPVMHCTKNFTGKETSYQDRMFYDWNFSRKFFNVFH